MADILNPIPGGPPPAPSVGSGLSGPRGANPSPPASGEVPPRPSAPTDLVTLQASLTQAPPPGSDEAPQTLRARGEKGREAAGTLDKAEKTLQEFLKNVPTDLQFTRDEAADRIVFKVVNPVTREVIRQVPSEEVLALARRLRQLEQPGKSSPGLLLDQEG